MHRHNSRSDDTLYFPINTPFLQIIHHIHLEAGGMLMSVLRELVKRNDLQDKFPKELIDETTGTIKVEHGFHDFLSCYDLVSRVIKTPEDLKFLTLEYLKWFAENGGVYAELTVSPHHFAVRENYQPTLAWLKPGEDLEGEPLRHAQRNYEQAKNALGRYKKLEAQYNADGNNLIFGKRPDDFSFGAKETLRAVEEAIDEARTKYQVEARILIAILRHVTPEEGAALVEETLRLDTKYVTGFTLVGDETQHASKFKDALVKAHDAGYQVTIHAGEHTDAKRMQEDIEHLGGAITRIGHGISAAINSAVMKYLQDNKLLCEICRKSNEMFSEMLAPVLRSTKGIEPGKILFKNGIPVSINSDDPLFMAGFHNDMEEAAKAWELDLTDVEMINKQSIEHSFCEELVKEMLLARIATIHLFYQIKENIEKHTPELDAKIKAALTTYESSSNLKNARAIRDLVDRLEDDEYHELKSQTIAMYAQHSKYNMKALEHRANLAEPTYRSHTQIQEDTKSYTRDKSVMF